MQGTRRRQFLSQRAYPLAPLFRSPPLNGNTSASSGSNRRVSAADLSSWKCVSRSDVHDGYPVTTPVFFVPHSSLLVPWSPPEPPSRRASCWTWTTLCVSGAFYTLAASARPVCCAQPFFHFTKHSTQTAMVVRTRRPQRPRSGARRRWPSMSWRPRSACAHPICRRVCCWLRRRARWVKPEAAGHFAVCRLPHAETSAKNLGVFHLDIPLL